MDKGVIFISTGEERFINEAIFSAKSLKKHNEGINITLFTDQNIRKKYFDRIIKIDTDLHPKLLKVKLLTVSPYKKTLFLDTDTQVLADISELFEIESDFIIANTPVVSNDNKSLKKLTSEDRYNTGVFVYDLNDKVLKFISRWHDGVLTIVEKKLNKKQVDQPVFNSLLLKEKLHEKYNIQITTIPNTVYNVRPWMVEELKKKGEFDNIKILHVHDMFYPWSPYNFDAGILDRLYYKVFRKIKI